MRYGFSSYMCATGTGTSRACLIVANVIAVCATWSTMGKGRSVSSGRGTIANVLLWDGEYSWLGGNFFILALITI